MEGEQTDQQFNIEDINGVKPIQRSSIFHRPLPSNVINLLILLVVAFIVLLEVLFRDFAMNIEQLRFFTTYSSNVDLIDKLLPLRICIGYVFFWYGIDNIEHPEVFNNLANIVLKKLKFEKGKIKLYPFGYLQAAIEILVALSLITGAFMDIGAFVGCLILFAVLFAYEEGLGSLLVRDVGLLGATLTVFLIVIAPNL